MRFDPNNNNNKDLLRRDVMLLLVHQYWHEIDSSIKVSHLKSVNSFLICINSYY